MGREIQRCWPTNAWPLPKGHDGGLPHHQIQHSAAPSAALPSMRAITSVSCELSHDSQSWVGGGGGGWGGGAGRGQPRGTVGTGQISGEGTQCSETYRSAGRRALPHAPVTHNRHDAPPRNGHCPAGGIPQRIGLARDAPIGARATPRPAPQRTPGAAEGTVCKRTPDAATTPPPPLRPPARGWPLAPPPPPEATPRIPVVRDPLRRRPPTDIPRDDGGTSVADGPAMPRPPHSRPAFPGRPRPPPPPPATVPGPPLRVRTAVPKRKGGVGPVDCCAVGERRCAPQNTARPPFGGGGGGYALHRGTRATRH